MFSVVLNFLDDKVVLGMAQATGAIIICAAVIVVCRCFAVPVGWEASISILRGLVQMVAVGIVLALLLNGSLLIGALMLLAMAVAWSRHFCCGHVHFLSRRS